MKILFIIICVIFSISNIRAASDNVREIDSLLQLAQRNFHFSKPSQCIFLSKKALLRSEEIGYKEGIIKSSFWIANVLSVTGDYSGSFAYVNKLLKNYSDYIDENPDFKYELIDLTGRNYLALGFRKQAIKEFKKEFILADLKSNYNEKQKMLFCANMQIAACYENYKPDSTIYYLNKVKAIHQIYPGLNHRFTVVMNLSLADYYLKAGKKLDSALHYNERFLKESNINSFYFMCSGLRQRAEILYQENKYEESLDYGFKALALAKDKKRIEDKVFIFKLLADNYHALGKYKEELFYIKKYTNIKDSLTKASIEGVQISADKISDEAAGSKNNNLWRNLLFGSLILTVIIGITISKIQRIKKRKNSIIDLKVNQLNKLQDERLEKAREELIISAKNNEPEFTIKFKEAYPELYEKLTQNQPALVHSELTFCGYLKLNFTTKEIAAYIGVTPRAVQIRKNRIRKKLNIPSGEDIYQWIDNFVSV